MRIMGAILIVVAASTPGYGQQLEQPPLIAPRRDMPPRPPLFPTPQLESQVWPRIPPRPELPPDRFLPPIQQSGPLASRSQTEMQTVPAPRSGPVCLMEVPVDPSIDRAFVIPVPDVGRTLTMRRFVVPPCVPLARQPSR